jgi:hypothetical protein
MFLSGKSRVISITWLTQLWRFLDNLAAGRDRCSFLVFLSEIEKYLAGVVF